MPVLGSLLVSLSLVLPGPVQNPEPRPALDHYLLGKDGLALDGYDPVSYFEKGREKPEQGDPAITATVRGVTYRFSSQANMIRFLAGPERYEPAYGGWCAWAMRSGEKVEPDFDSYTITDGRLCLFYQSFFADTRKKWLGDPLRSLARADTNWALITGEGKDARPAGHWNLDAAGVVLAGYDPVSYRAEGPPAPGLAQLETEYQGVRYRFATEANQKAFLADPARYEPAYGGWCAQAMRKGTKVDVDPLVYDASGDALLLFANKGALEDWREDPATAREQAEARWTKALTSLID